MRKINSGLCCHHGFVRPKRVRKPRGHLPQTTFSGSKRFEEVISVVLEGTKRVQSVWLDCKFKSPSIGPILKISTQNAYLRFRNILCYQISEKPVKCLMIKHTFGRLIGQINNVPMFLYAYFQMISIIDRC